MSVGEIRGLRNKAFTLHFQLLVVKVATPSTHRPPPPPPHLRIVPITLQGLLFFLSSDLTYHVARPNRASGDKRHNKISGQNSKVMSTGIHGSFFKGREE